MRIDDCLRDIETLRGELMRRQHEVEGQKEELMAIRGFVQLQSKTIYILISSKMKSMKDAVLNFHRLESTNKLPT